MPKPKIKLCDPFCTRKPLVNASKDKDKTFKEKKGNQIPKSLQKLMEGVKLLKEIDQKNKLKKLKKPNGKTVNQNKNITTTPTPTTPTPKTESKPAIKIEVKKEEKETKVIPNTTTPDTTTENKIENNNNENTEDEIRLPKNKKRNNNNTKKNNQLTEPVVDEATDTSKELQRLKELYTRGSNEDRPEEKNDISMISLARKKGENDHNYQIRIRKAVIERARKNTNTHKKMKDYYSLQKLKQKLKKQGIKYSDYLAQQEREKELEEAENLKESKENNNDNDAIKKKKKMDGGGHSEEARKKYLQQQKKRKFDDFSELKDNIKFGEQAERPPQELPTLKDFKSKSQLPNIESSKREYLWQTQLREKEESFTVKKSKTDNNSNSDEEQMEVDDNRKRNLEILKTKANENYQRSKKRKQQLTKIKSEKEAEASGNPLILSSKPNSFYL